MRHLPLLLFLLAAALAAGCSVQGTSPDIARIDSLNERAYSYCYKQMDSVRLLAAEAHEQARRLGYTDGMAEAMNTMMFERFQQMDFDSVVQLAARLESLGAGEVERLVCDVMQMKVDQRTSDNRFFFLHRSHALQRLHALQRRQDRLSAHVRRRLDYARSELHIIASTYFYYVDQRERALDEIRQAQPLCSLPEDTAQWLYYNYMRGSGGLAESTGAEEVTLEEFDHLMLCFVIARTAGYPFFEANSAQSLATLCADSVRRACINQRRPEMVHYLTGIFTADSTAYRLAEWALTLFSDYDDLYQTACALRTMGELAFDDGRYADAIDFYTAALDCVNFHHDVYYAADSVLDAGGQKLLLPFDPDGGEESVERRWLRQQGVRTVPEWIAGIRQQLSVAYSAMNLKHISDYNRNIYIDLLDVTREDAELESRATMLHAESRRLHRLLAALALAAAAVLLIAVLLFRNWRRRGEDSDRRLRQQMQQLQDESLRRSAMQAEEQEQLHEQQQATELRIQRDKRLNVEKRAKLSLVHGIVPFLDRIIHEVRKMLRAGEANDASLQYIRELIQPITEYNELLTEWIQVEQGQLSLQLSTFELEPLFASLRQSHFAYEQKGLRLNVMPTALAVKADRALTLFMLNTLADNARKFTAAGGSVTISATAGENEQGPYVELSVQDTGCGLSQADVDLILNNKVYDAALIGQTTAAGGATHRQQTALPAEADDLAGSGRYAHSGKGFGFGLMNCKGIIEKLRKTNPLFRVCLLGIESRVGKGSRFFFRLPRVALALAALLLQVATLATAAPSAIMAADAPAPVTPVTTPSEAYRLMDSVYYCNVQGRYAVAIGYAAGVLDQLNAMGLPGRMQLRPLTDDVAEVAWWQRREAVDFSLILGLRNEVAVAALALHDWTLYRMNNRVYKRLYKLLGQDLTLEAYCRQTEITQRNERLTLLAVILLLAVAMLLLAVFWLRPLLRRRRASMELSEQQLEAAQAAHEAEYRRRQEDLELAEDEHRRRLYEEGRLHVQNQIIDNCLSSIKHETMYYPGRILQLAERQPVDLQTLSETVSYYKDIFTLLSAQADSQSAAVSFRRHRTTFADVSARVSARFQGKVRRMGLAAELRCIDESDAAVATLDADLLLVLFDELLDYELVAVKDSTGTDGHAPDSAVAVLTLCADADARFLRFTLENPAVSLTTDELHNFFMPHRGGIPLLVVKQIIREHDTFLGHPGCRITAESAGAGGHRVWFTLPLAANK